MERIFFCVSKKKGVDRVREEEDEENKKEKETKKTIPETLYIICVFHIYYWCGFKI